VSPSSCPTGFTCPGAALIASCRRSSSRLITPLASSSSHSATLGWGRTGGVIGVTLSEIPAPGAKVSPLWRHQWPKTDEKIELFWVASDCSNA
jgi:hypothetical protein